MELHTSTERNPGVPARYRGVAHWSGRQDYEGERECATPETAELAACRDLWRRYPLAGAALVEALADVVARLRACVRAPSPAALRAARLRAAALGASVRGQQARIDREPGEHAAAWLVEVESRLAVARERRERTLLCGPVGRPGARYTLIGADPPWLYDDQGTRLAPGYEGEQRVRRAYPPLPDAEIAALGEQVRAASAESALLLMWTTDAVLLEGRDAAICRAWGFEPKVTIPWIKTTQDRSDVRIGGGHYTRHVTETIRGAVRGDLDLYYEGDRLILAARGSASRRVVSSRSVRGILLGPPARREHSSKPEAWYALAEQLVGEVPRLEVFARRARPGWDAWGNEVPAAGDVEALEAAS